jgi:hypothetical protein
METGVAAGVSGTAFLALKNKKSRFAEGVKRTMLRAQRAQLPIPLRGARRSRVSHPLPQRVVQVRGSPRGVPPWPCDVRAKCSALPLHESGLPQVAASVLLGA